VFTWIVSESEEADPSVVTRSIEPAGAGCVATIVHQLDSKWKDYIPQTERGWSRMLDAVEGLLG
jgi:hypothetical protein